MSSQHFPAFESFRRLADGRQLAPVARRLVSDLLTPVTAFCRIDSARSACLFESVIGGEKVGRYSFLAADPLLELSARGAEITVTAEDRVERYESDDPLEEGLCHRKSP